MLMQFVASVGPIEVVVEVGIEAGVDRDQEFNGDEALFPRWKFRGCVGYIGCEQHAMVDEVGEGLVLEHGQVAELVPLPVDGDSIGVVLVIILAEQVEVVVLLDAVNDLCALVVLEATDEAIVDEDVVAVFGPSHTVLLFGWKQLQRWQGEECGAAKEGTKKGEAVHGGMLHVERSAHRDMRR